MTNLPQPLPVAGDDPQTTTGLVDPSPLRASDSEREAAAVSLRDHCTAGRLSPDELSQRLDLVYASKTNAALQILFNDLPTPPASDASTWPQRVFRPSGRLIALPALTAAWP